MDPIPDKERFTPTQAEPADAEWVEPEGVTEGEEIRTPKKTSEKNFLERASKQSARLDLSGEAAPPVGASLLLPGLYSKRSASTIVTKGHF
jgi:hypothetical protein